MTTEDTPDIVMLSCGHLPHWDALWDGDFNDHQALHLTVGALDLWYGDKHHRLEGAWFWWGLPGPRTRFRPAPGVGGCSHRYVTYHGPLATRWAFQGLLPDEPQPAPDDECAGRFDALLTLAGRSDPWGRRRALNALEGLLLALADARTQPLGGRGWLDAVLAELAGGEFAPDYAALATRHGVSLTTLREHFRRATGTSPHAYVLQARLARARRLLDETDLPLKAIAAQLGYDDDAYFSRQFHRTVGASPAAYRRSRQR